MSLALKAVAARAALAASLVIVPAVAHAAVSGLEFSFSPYLGNPDQNDAIMLVGGEARIYVNGLPHIEVEVRERKHVMNSAGRDITPAAVIIDVASFGTLLRKGRNTLRVDFFPADYKRAYTVELRWTPVGDATTGPRAAKGAAARGPVEPSRERINARSAVRIEREFDADFATGRAWHQYPAVTALSDADREQIRALLVQRLHALQPGFGVFYAWLARNNFVVAEIRKDRVPEKIQAAGLLVRMADTGRLEFLIGPGAGVMVKPPLKEPLYWPENPSVLSRISDAAAQEFARSILPRLFPTRLMVARNADGVWEAVD